MPITAENTEQFTYGHLKYEGIPYGSVPVVKEEKR